MYLKAFHYYEEIGPNGQPRDPTKMKYDPTFSTENKLVFDIPFNFCPTSIQFRAYSCNSFIVLSKCGGNHNNVFFFKFETPIEQKLIKDEFFRTPALTLVNKFHLPETQNPRLCYGSNSVSVFDENWIGTNEVEPINFSLNFKGEKSISYPIKEFFGPATGYTQKLVTWTCN